MSYEIDLTSGFESCVGGGTSTYCRDVQGKKLPKATADQDYQKKWGGNGTAYQPTSRSSDKEKSDGGSSGSSSTRAPFRINMTYSHAASHGMTAYDVATPDAVGTRVANAPQQVIDTTQKAIDRIDVERRRIEENQRILDIARKRQDIGKMKKAERSIVQSRLMIDATTKELEVVYLTGPQTQSYDHVNPHGSRQKSRTDVETEGSYIEVTIGQSRKNPKQLNDYIDATEATGKKPVLYAPNMRDGAVKSAERKGFEVVSTVKDLYDFMLHDTDNLFGPEPEKLEPE